MCAEIPRGATVRLALLGEDEDHPTSWIVPLSGLSPIARGQESDVYERPGKPSQLVKVHREKRITALTTSPRLRDRIRVRTASGPYRNFLRVYQSYLDAVMQAGRIGRPPPLPQLRGFVQTDRGLGLVIQKIRSADGQMAPTLKRLRREGALEPEVIQALNRFACDLYAFNIVATDLRYGNLVYETYKGRSRIVMIDGFGSRTLIPVRSWSRRLNARALDGLFGELARQLDLTWDAGSRSFSRTG